MKQLLCAAALVTTILSACQKKDDTVADPLKVTTDISTPALGQTYQNGDTVFINATISYPSELHGYEVKITDTVTGLILFDDAQHVHTDHFEIHDQWKAAASTPTTLLLTVTANIDHDGNDAKTNLNFMVIP